MESVNSTSLCLILLDCLQQEIMGKTAMMQSLQVVFLITRNDMCRRLTNYCMMVYLLQMYVNNIQNERKQQKIRTISQK